MTTAPTTNVGNPRSVSSGLYAAIFRSIASGEVPLPALPDLVLRMRSAAGGQASSFNAIARIIKTEPGLASYILKLSNSPAFQSRYPATDLAAAINRLGMATVMNVSTSYSMRNLFRCKQPALRNYLRDLWRSSVRLAATCAVLASKVTKQNADRALLAGLLANIGALPLVNAAAVREDIQPDPDTLTAIVETYGRQVGCMMLRNWHIDEELINAVKHHGDWAKAATEGKPDLSDLVLISHYLILQNDGLEVPGIDQFPTWFKLQGRFPRVQWDAALIREMSSHVSTTERSLGSPA